MNRPPFYLPFWFFVAFLLSMVSQNVPAEDRPDIVIADFESDTYNDWAVEGEAFGSGPAAGTLPGQMHVSGYLGKGLVNSFLNGDNTKGMLRSPKFKIERPYISFLVGGGGHDGLGIRLIADGKVVRAAQGKNVVDGGTEQLEWHDWDVADLQGQEASIEIFDDRGGSWGHINVDHIIQTDRKHAPEPMVFVAVPTKEFLHLPISRDAPTTWIRVEVDGKWQQEFHCTLTVAGEPDFYANFQVGQWKNQKVELIIEQVPAGSIGPSLIVQSDEMPHKNTIYKEKYRPQFHFSPRIGWTNDPNGLVYYKGLWHVFYQHNPYGTVWGNMTWGHATSPDLLHWTEQTDAIHPDPLGTIFSGSGVVDWNNTSGFRKGDEKPLVFFYTYHGPTARFGAKTSQGLAYSTDGGKTFVKYENNPIIPHIIGENRDPKVIWHEDSKQWILALYMDGDDFALFGSKNLKEWQKLSDVKELKGSPECPDFFPLPVDGDKNNIKWVFWGGNGKYLIGTFDGKNFHPETGVLNNKYGGNDYAAMTFSDAPNGRRIQLSWMSTGGEFQGMPFNQQFSVPRELTLRTTPQGKLNLYTEPVEELKKLRGEMSEVSQLVIQDKTEELIPNARELFDCEMQMRVGDARKVTLNFAGRQVEYDTNEKRIALGEIQAPLELVDGVLKLRVVVDRTSIEIFAQDGEVQICRVFRPESGVSHNAVVISSQGGDATMEKMKIWTMESCWNR